MHCLNLTERPKIKRDILMARSTACFNVLKTEGEKHGLTIATFDPLSCFSSTEDLSEIKSSTGFSIWREDDTVHLTVAAYNDIAAVLANQAKNNGKQPLTGQCHPSRYEGDTSGQGTSVDQW